MKTDVEDILDAVKLILTTHLNTKIQAINAEKADAYTLKEINDSAYFLQTMDAAQANYDPYIFYGVGEMADEPAPYPGGRTAYRLDLDVLIVVADHGNDVNIGRRMLRYQRALKEVFEEHFDELPGRSKLSVKSQVPVTIQLLNSSHRHRVVGVLLGTDLA